MRAWQSMWGILWLATSVGCARHPAPRGGSTPRPRGPGVLTARPLGTTAAASGYYEYLPPGYGDGTRRPLLLFLHGVGENGNGQSELARVLKHGPLELVKAGAWPGERPFVVLSPQHRPAPIDPHVGRDCPTADEIHAFLSFGVARYEVDPARVYLTGLSCGAIGSWRYLERFLGEQIAAAVLIAGDGRDAWAAKGCALANAVPIWGFHGDADRVVPAAGTIEPMTSLMRCPLPPRADQRLTVYPGVGHDSWTQTYAVAAPANDIYDWMLRLSR
jgi:predicted peptidase